MLDKFNPVPLVQERLSVTKREFLNLLKTTDIDIIAIQ